LFGDYDELLTPFTLLNNPEERPQDKIQSSADRWPQPITAPKKPAPTIKQV
jgi:hypothetical protein